MLAGGRESGRRETVGERRKREGPKGDASEGAAHAASGFLSNSAHSSLALGCWASRAHRFGQAAGAREGDVLLLARWRPKAAAGAPGVCWRQHATAGGQWGASLATAAERRHGPVVRGQQPRPAGPERHAARGAAR